MPALLKVLLLIPVTFALIVGVMGNLAKTSKTFAEPDTYFIFNDVLADGWQSWSWGSEVTFTNQISFKPYPWGGLYLHINTPLTADNYSHLRFSVKSIQAQKLSIIAYDQNNAPVQQAQDIDPFLKEEKDGWKIYEIPVSQLGLQSKQFSGIALQEANGMNQIHTYVDNVYLIKPVTTQQALTNIINGTTSDQWENWSWGGEVHISDTLKFKSHAPWAGLFLHSKQDLEYNEKTSLQFRAKLTEDSSYQVALYDNSNSSKKGFMKLQQYKTADAPDGWKTYTVPFLDFVESGSKIRGIVIQDAHIIPGREFWIDDINITKSEVSKITQVVQNMQTTDGANTTTTVTTQAKGQSTGYTVSQNKIYNNGQEVRLRGVNWFGFETETLSAHGLWARNWKEMIGQMKQVGFNAVRVPFCPKTLGGFPTNGIDTYKNPDLVGLNSLQVLDKVLEELNNQQMYILLDHHRPDCQAISELWYTQSYSEQQWISELEFVAKRYQHLPFLFGIDLKNEPHGRATWGTGDAATDWNIAAEKAGRAVLNTNPNVLIFVEGVQENSHCSSNIGHWMGGNMEPIVCNPLSTQMIPADKLVLSPHVYGPDVYIQGYFNEASFPSNMPAIWNTHFGNLLSKGYTIIPGEWGGRFGQADYRDATWQRAFAQYMQQNRICNSFYWSWNPNSSDTGGILKDDWHNVWSDKLDFLQSFYKSCQ